MAPAEAELPRAVRKGPPITVTCECGERRDLRYGERWECESCGRRWDTSQIPLEEYAAIRRGQVRQLIAPAAAALIVLAISVFAIVSGRAVLAVVIVPFAGYMWSQFVRPARQRRRRKQLADLPRWNIKQE